MACMPIDISHGFTRGLQTLFFKHGVSEWLIYIHLNRNYKLELFDYEIVLFNKMYLLQCRFLQKKSTKLREYLPLQVHVWFLQDAQHTIALFVDNSVRGVHCVYIGLQSERIFIGLQSER